MNLSVIENKSDIAALTQHRPEPCYEHVSSAMAAETWSTLSASAFFWNKETTFFKRPVDISLSSAFWAETTFSHKNVVIPADYEYASTSLHTIALSHNDVKIYISEHIVGLLTAMNHAAHIHLEWWNSWPTEKACVQDYLHAIQDVSVSTSIPIEYVTPMKSFFLRAKNGAYVGFIPAAPWNKMLTVDLMVEYPGTSIGTQRIKVDIDDDIVDAIVSARPPSHGLRGRLVHTMHKLPLLNTLINIHPNNTLRFADNYIKNPREEYYTDDSVYIELVFHEVLDKLWALGLIGWKRKLAWTFVSYKANHSMDLALLRHLIQSWLVQA
jgi:UDP-3-O-acyl-N-acetylglucosamine deacetylase